MIDLRIKSKIKDQTGRLSTVAGWLKVLTVEAEEDETEEEVRKLVNMRGRSLASSSSSSSDSEVVRLTQEQRSRDAKKAEATLVPNHLARPSSFS